MMLSPPASARAATVSPTTAPALSRHVHGQRVGGPVHSAWPAKGRAPRTSQARWLARQVGTIEPRLCATQRRHARRRCQLGRAATSGSGSALPLKLVRSYAIPADDPSYKRLLNWSWTYDSAVSAAAFAATGDGSNAQQLLDQLAALQHTAGSIEIAFDTGTGQNAPVFRAGAVAWLGLAAATYDAAFDTGRYLDTERRAADYLLSLQTASGLIKGGPDVSWVSTQHNLIAYVFLVRLANELDAAGATTTADRYFAAGRTIAAQINASLLVDDAAGAHFRQGLNDDTQALDVQAFGAMYLQGTGQPALAAEVLAYAQSRFALSGRAVTTSSKPATYNMTYASAGPFSGYAPYVGTGAPAVRWAEGSGEMRLAQAALGQDTRVLDASIASWLAITKGAGALQADQTLTSDAYGVEYHVWPASTAAAWTILAQTAPAFFAAPLQAATALIAGWSEVRGGSLITTYSDGRVSMASGTGERRVLADPATTGSDYTVTANATLLSGAGYGLYVRAGVDKAGLLTGYAVQLEHSSGQVVVRQIQSDFQLSAALAHANAPAGFNWYRVPHVLAVSVRGNAMNVTVDGAQSIDVPDLAAASAAAVKASYGVFFPFTPPAAGGYGLRAWSDGLVTLQQMTVGPAA
jgi:hypothetical protein